jgi:hypothetical protein
MVKPRDPAWLPAPYQTRDIECVKAVAEGKAGPEEQKRAIKWIMDTAAGDGELSFRSDTDGGDRETAFAEGRRFVALQIKKLRDMPGPVVAELRKKEEKRNA